MKIQAIDWRKKWTNHTFDKDLVSVIIHNELLKINIERANNPVFKSSKEYIQMANTHIKDAHPHRSVGVDHIIHALNSKTLYTRYCCRETGELLHCQ